MLQTARTPGYAYKQGRHITHSTPAADINTPCAALGALTNRSLSLLHADDLIAKVEQDAVLKPLYVQTLNHLQHVRFSFRTENHTYPHSPVLSGPYPAAATRKALTKASAFFAITAGRAGICGVTARGDAATWMAAQKTLVAAITKDPLGYYTDYKERLQQGGAAAPFPEFGAVVEYLICEMLSGEAAMLAAQNPHLAAFRRLTLEQLAATRPQYPYAQTIDAIERGVEFFDIVARALHPEKSPPLYHGHRYEYYTHFLSADIDGHVFFPTIAPLGVTDLLKARGVPISFIGVNTKIERVDGFCQTPYEFFIHDVNHCRRMLQFFREETARQGVTPDVFIRRACAYVQDTLLPLFCVKKSDDAATREKKKTAKMILFEILHEDALPADPDVIRTAMLRSPRQLTPFERIEGDTVVYIMEPGATTLAYVFRKLAHTFYDAPKDRRDYIVTDAFRSRAAVLEAAERLFADLKLGPVPYETLSAYVETDAGFPDDFKRELVTDIACRGLESLRED